MTEPLIEVVSVELVTDPAVPTDRPCIVVSWDHDLDPAAPTLRWDVVASSALAPPSGIPDGARATMRDLGQVLHQVAHALLAEQSAVLDLTSPQVPRG